MTIPTGEPDAPLCLRVFNFRHEADMAAAFLGSHGLETHLLGDDCGAVDPALGMIRGARLMIAAADFEEAKQLLDSAGADAAPDNEE